MKGITQTVRNWRLHRLTEESAKQQLARRYNATVRGWIAYYGKHWYRNFSYRLWSVLQSRLIKWVEAKYRLGPRAASHRLNLMKKEDPSLFALVSTPCIEYVTKSRMTGYCHVRFRKHLRGEIPLR
jgi:RNA-directed DNA polymerase